jgi:hypothetical protein
MSIGSCSARIEGVETPNPTTTASSPLNENRGCWGMCGTGRLFPLQNGQGSPGPSKVLRPPGGVGFGETCPSGASPVRQFPEAGRGVPFLYKSSGDNGSSFPSLEEGWRGLGVSWKKQGRGSDS